MHLLRRQAHPEIGLVKLERVRISQWLVALALFALALLPRGAALASYLLFAADFTRELMALGESDTLVRREEVAQFFGWQPRWSDDGHGLADGPAGAPAQHASGLADPIAHESVHYFAGPRDASPLPA